MTRKLIHVTTTDMSLELLLGPQLSAFVDAGYQVFGASAPGRYVEQLEARGRLIHDGIAVARHVLLIVG